MAIFGGINWPAVQAALHAWVVNGSGLPADHVMWEGQNAPRPREPAISMKIKGFDAVGTDWLDVEDNVLVLPTLPILSVSGSSLVFPGAGHTLNTGDGPIRVQSSGAVPGGSAPDTDYWAIADDPTHLRLATTFLRARTGVQLTLTDAGAGSIAIVGTPSTARAGAEIKFLARGLRQVVMTLECYVKVGVGMSMALAVLAKIAGRQALPGQQQLMDDADIGIEKFDPIRAIHGAVNAVIFEPRARVDIHLTLPSEDSETGTYIQRADLTDTIANVTTRVPVGDA